MSQSTESSDGGPGRVMVDVYRGVGLWRWEVTVDDENYASGTGPSAGEVWVEATHYAGLVVAREMS